MCWYSWTRSIHHCTQLSPLPVMVFIEGILLSLHSSITSIMCWYSWTRSIHHCTLTAVYSSIDDIHRKHSSITAQQFVSWWCADIHEQDPSIIAPQLSPLPVMIYIKNIRLTLYSCLLFQFWYSWTGSIHHCLAVSSIVLIFTNCIHLQCLPISPLSQLYADIP
jgi:hypothetical protein